MNRQRERFDVRTLVTLGMLTALAYGAMAVCKLIPKVAGFLSLDVIDAVLGVGAFLFGPMAAVCMSLVESFIEMITLGSSGWYGFFMNVVSTVFFLVPAAWLYRRRRTVRAAVVGLAVGILCRTAGMAVWNYIVTPFYFGMPRQMVVELMPTILIFNLVKAVLNAALIMVLYPPVSSTLRRAGLIPPSGGRGAGETRRFNYVPLVVSAVVLVMAVLGFWAMLNA